MKINFLKLYLIIFLLITLCFPRVILASPSTDKNSESNTSVKINEDTNNKPATNQQIRVAIYPNPPLQSYTVINSELVVSGLSIDYLELLFKDTDYTFTYTFYDSLESVVYSDDFDIAFISTSCQLSNKDFLFSNPYASFPIVSVKNTTNFLSNSFSDIDNKPCITNSNTLKLLNNSQRYPSNFSLYQDVRQALFYISQNPDTIYIDNMATALYGIQQYGFHNLTIYDTSEYSEEMLIGINPNKKELYQLIIDKQNALHSLDLLELKERWMPALLNKTKSGSGNTIDLSSSEKAFLKEHPVIRVANDLHWAPYSYTVDGKPMGISTDILRIIENKLDISFDIVTGYSWDELTLMSQTREIDILQPVIYHKSRSDYLTVTEPIFNVHHSVLETPLNPISSIEDLYGKRIGIGKGYTISKIIADKYPEINLVPFDSISEGLTTLNSGKLDGYIMATEVANHYLRAQNYPNVQVSTTAHLPSDISNTIRLGIRDDWPILVKIMNKAINSFTVEELQSLTTKWGTENLLPSQAGDLNYEEQNWLLEHPVVTVGLYPTWEPIDYVDNKGNPQGISKLYLDTIEEKLGIQFEIIQDSNWERLYNKTVTGEIDMIAAISRSELREHELLFTDSYLTTPIVIFGNKKNQFFTQTSDLNGKRVGVIESFAINDYIKQDHKDLQLLYAQSTLDALNMLADGEIDAFIGSLPVTSYYIDSQDFKNIYVSGKTEYTYNDSFATNFDHTILHSIMKKTLASISEEEKDYINTTWFSNQIVTKPNYTLFLTILFIALLIIVVVLYWYIRLQNLYNELKEDKKIIERLTITDELSGLHNRRYFNQVFNRELTRAKRENKIFVFGLIDIDHFKGYNDNYGHGKGDEIIQAVSTAIREDMRRPSDYCFRLGGEEFGIIYTTDSELSVLDLPEIILQSVQDLNIEHLYNENYDILTVSIGVCPVGPHESYTKEDIYKCADTALYQSKSKGRNRIYRA